MSEENQNPDPKTIKIKVSSEEMTKVLEKNIEKDKEIKELKEKVAESEEAIKRNEAIKEKACLEFETLTGQSVDPTEIKTDAELERMISAITTIRNQKAKESHGTNPSGSAPLNSAQYGRSNEVSFSNENEMVDFIRDMASHSNPDVQSRDHFQKILNELMRKSFSGQKQQGTIPFSYQGKDVLEFRKKQFERRKKFRQQGES
jgi:hypothetical protein